MIRLNRVNKYFNKNKSNQIHVINNATLEFNSTGLVCLLGPSGSGKTTLLNVIGGLDKIDSGEIEFKEYKISKYKANKWDVIRNYHFGYIFQNYVLLPELTVYQNLELVLKMLNLDKEEIERRIDYALEAVGMVKYKKRRPGQLSGGQQQRVAIARALVKSPDVVIADEPTGNLDEKNTTQIMNIIKKISKECLVILVTHERRLADFYADRIIEISDGKIVSDREVASTNELKMHDDVNIYLKEFNIDSLGSDDVKIKYFYPEEKIPIELNIIFKDNTFYIHSPMETVKIKYIDKSSEIKVIDDKRPKIESQNIENFDYHLPKIDRKGNKKLKSVISFLDTIKMALRHLNGLRRRQKLMFVVMVLSSIMITIGFINLFTARKVDEESFLYFNRNTVLVDSDYSNIKNELLDDEIVLANIDLLTVSFFSDGYFAPFNEFIYLANNIGERSASVVPVDVIDNVKIYNNYGRLIEKPNEALIDLYLVELFLNQASFQSAGIKYPEQFIGLKFSIDGEVATKKLVSSFEIVGIVNNNNPNIYLHKTGYQNAIISSVNTYNFSNFVVWSIDQVKTDYYYEIVDGELGSKKDLSSLTLKDNEALINRQLYYFLESAYGNELLLTLFYNQGLKVVGVTDILFESEVGLSAIYVTESFSNNYYNVYLENQNTETYILTKNPTSLIERLSSKGIKSQTFYDYEMDRLAIESLNLDLFITSLVILIGSLVFLYFLMRSSLMNRIYEVGVYRALGISKNSIRKIFFTEILIVTVITALVGIFLVSRFIKEVNSIIQTIYYPMYIPPVSLVFILITNTVVGLLPVNNLLRFTPSQILSKYDV